MNRRWTLTFLAWITISAASFSAEDELWTKAQRAYQLQQTETGHIYLNRLIEKNPGDVELALKCLTRIMKEAEARTHMKLRWMRHLKFIENHWAEQASRRLLSLERIGAISSNSKLVQDAFETLLEHHLLRGRLLEGLELVNYFVRRNKQDPFWRIVQARFYRRLRSSKARELYQQLQSEIDLDHPEATVRERWANFVEEMKADKSELPPAIQPLPQGSPLPLMKPDDPDGKWRIIANRPIQKTTLDLDRLISKSLITERIVAWKDGSGIVDPLRALDLHLLSQSALDLEPLRKLQSRRFTADESNPLTLFRRYPWTTEAQKRLLTHAQRQLWNGQIHAALRCFRDVINHTADAKVRSEAQVGLWAAWAQITPSISVEKLLGKVDADQTFPWLGKPVKAGEICQQLLKNQKTKKEESLPSLKEMKQHVIRTPPISGWASNLPNRIDLSVMDDHLLVSGRDLLAMYDANAPTKTLWSHSQRQHIDQQQNRRYYPGYFRPLFHRNSLITRWGFTSVPQGIASLDSVTGRPQWSVQAPILNQQRQRQFTVPMGDPTLVDGRMYYLQWHALHQIHHNRDRSLSLICYDPQKREAIWEKTLVKAGQTRDILGRFEQVPPETAIYGNPVTVHDGSIYSSSNCGFIARSDIRDGRTDWIYGYRRTNRRNALNLGSAPIVVGDLVICMPRDADRVFALDTRTGRLVWENPFVDGRQIIGTLENLLIVQEDSQIVTLDQSSGEVRWYRPMSGPIHGRCLLVKSALYVPQLEELIRLDAKTGSTEQTRDWNLTGERPRAFALNGRNLYVVTDKPAGREGQALNASMPKETPAFSEKLQRAWKLSRRDAIVTLAPKGSPLAGRGLIYSEGVLECVDISAQGAVRWRRFLNAQNPSFHFVEKKLLVIDRPAGRIPGQRDRVLAYDEAGRALWEHVMPYSAHQTLNCGEHQVFHDSRSRAFALNLQTGEQIWNRDFGLGNMLRFAWDGTKLQAFYVSRQREPRHLSLDVSTGIGDRNHTVEPIVTNDQINAKPIKDGYYEVKIKPVKARYVRLVALSEVNGGRWASAAELRVIGKDGKNIPREKLKISKVSSFESNHKTNGWPALLIDGDRKSWWHSPWIGGIPPHPHWVELDLGEEQIITGIRYLPAVIINNNGMIRDYELYVSKDGQNIGKPVAKGILVSRVHVDRAHVADNAIVFETNDRWTRRPQVFRYAMDGKPARLIRDNARIVHLQSPYFVSSERKNNQEIFVVYRLDNESYRFELGPVNHIDRGLIQIVDDRLMMPRRGVLIADLKSRQVLVRPDPKKKSNQNGMILREGKDHLLKIVNRGGEGQIIYRFDLRNGQESEFVLTKDPMTLADRRPDYQRHRIQQIDRVLLLCDNVGVTAWVSRIP